MIDVQGYCLTDNDSSSQAALSACDDIHEAAYAATIFALDHADPPLSDGDYCAAQYAALEADLQGRKDCIDAHTQPMTICPCGTLNGATVILDFMPDDSIPWSFCAYRGVVPATYYRDFGPLNCNKPLTTTDYFEFWAYVFPQWGEEDKPIGAIVYVYAPWGPHDPHQTTYGTTYDADADPLYGAVPAEDWCSGESVDLVPIDLFTGEEDDPVYADEVDYIMRKDTPFPGTASYVCGDRDRLNAFAATISCYRPTGINWFEFAAAPYPDTYTKTEHYPITIDDVHSIGGEF